MWIGSFADPAIKRTARVAGAWVISPSWTPGRIEEKLHFYQSALQEFGRSGQVTETILRCDIHLGATSQAVRQEAQVLFDKGYRGYDPQERQESLIVGSPEDCIVIWSTYSAWASRTSYFVQPCATRSTCSRPSVCSARTSCRILPTPSASPLYWPSPEGEGQYWADSAPDTLCPCLRELENIVMELNMRGNSN
jgi:hypothetical protein